MARRKQLKKIWGQYDYESGEITIHNTLVNRHKPTRPAVLYHEQFHKYIHENNIKMPPKQEEILADVWAVLNCKPREMGFGDLILKKIIKREIKQINIKRLINDKNTVLNIINGKYEYKCGK